MRNVSNKSCREIKIQISYSVTFFLKLSVYEIMSKNMVVPERPQMAIWRRVAWWIIKTTRVHESTRTHSRAHTHKYVRHIALPPQQWFRERALILPCTYIASLVWGDIMAAGRSKLYFDFDFANLYKSLLILMSEFYLFAVSARGRCETCRLYVPVLVIITHRICCID